MGATLLALALPVGAPDAEAAKKKGKAKPPVARAKVADDARRVGGLKASKRPRPGYLLALGKDGKFPASVLPPGVGGLTATAPSLSPTAPATPSLAPLGPTYSAGTGLVLDAGAFSIDRAVVQRRLTGNCAVGKALVGISAEGVAECTDVVGKVTAGTGLSATTSGATTNLAIAPPLTLTSATSGTPFRSTNTGSGVGAEVASKSAFASLYVSNSGTGGGIRSDTGSAGQGSAFTGYNYGLNRNAGEFELVNSANAGAAVYARTAGNGQAIDAEVNSNTNGDALFARTTSSSSSSYAGIFVGNVSISGNLAKSSGSFRIDHPLDPERKYLSHSFVESPDMKNLYDGVVETDDAGLATVRLPDWFDALNRDFRYVLTPIRSFSRATVWEEISDNAFVIRTEDPGVRVSWQVTGIREDAYARKHPIRVEEDKAPEDVGNYLTPDAFGKPADRSIMQPER